MKVELRNVRTWRGMEGHGYQATILVDGVDAAMATDEGRGGPIRWEVHNEAALRFFALECGVDDPLVATGVVKCDTEMDQRFAALVDAWDQRRWLKRHCATKTLFRLPDDRDGEYRTVKAKYSPAVRAFILRKYPNAVILNDEVQR